MMSIYTYIQYKEELWQIDKLETVKWKGMEWSRKSNSRKHRAGGGNMGGNFVALSSAISLRLSDSGSHRAEKTMSLCGVCFLPAAF